MYWELIHGWFNFQSLYSDMVRKFNDAMFVEIGCWKGKSTVYMAEQIKKSRKNILFTAIDLFPVDPDLIGSGPAVEAEFFDNIRPVANYINFIKGSSHDLHSIFADKSIDFIFIDGNHHYPHVKKDIELWFPKLKDEGVIAGHDYWLGDVKQAVDGFFDKKDFKIKIVLSKDGDYWIVTKKHKK
jgi:predicted O-methyltransferase YrrM